MAIDHHGELVPVGGGDPITLVRPLLTIGRRNSCDICLQFPNISGKHCQLELRDGYWLVRDLGSTNGIKVNGQRVLNRPLRPGDEVQIGKRRYTIQYTPPAHALAALESVLTESEDITSMTLLEKAGLEKTRRPPGKLYEDDEDE